jgi:hypothetical protein
MGKVPNIDQMQVDLNELTLRWKHTNQDDIPESIQGYVTDMHTLLDQLCYTLRRVLPDANAAPQLRTALDKLTKQAHRHQDEIKQELALLALDIDKGSGALLEARRNARLLFHCYQNGIHPPSSILEAVSRYKT